MTTPGQLNGLIVAIALGALVGADGVAHAGPAGPASGDPSAGQEARGTPVETPVTDAPYAQWIRVGEGGVLEASAVAAVLEAAIAARLPADRFEVEWRGLRDVQVGAGEIELVVILPADVEEIGAHLAEALARRGTGVVRTFQIPLRVARWCTAPVIAVPLRHGELVTAEHLRLERRLVEGRDRPLDGLEAAIDMRARRTLQVGHLLVDGDLEPVPLVFRNETVRVLLRRGAIEIEMRGVSLADGWLGDRVRVRNPTTRKLVTAVVSGTGEVRLSE